MFKQIRVLFEDVYINNKEKLFTFICDNKSTQSLFFDYYSNDDAFVSLDNRRAEFATLKSYTNQSQ